MSTRATYQINDMTFYVHSDGYPTGAAHRFAAMIQAKTVHNPEGSFRGPVEDRRGGFAFAFIRGNLDAEATTDHQSHGDTEWRYSIHEIDGHANITVSERLDFGDPDLDASWKNSTHDLADWLNATRLEVVEQIKRAQSLYPAPHPMACIGDPMELALAEIPVIVKVIEPSNYGKPNVTYATLDVARTISEALLASAEALPAGNYANRLTLRTQADVWSLASGDAQASAHL